MGKQSDGEASSAGRQVIKLSRKVKFEDIERDELVLDLEGLTGADLMAAEAEFIAKGGTPGVQELSKRFQSHIAARAAKVPVEFIEKLPINDASKVTLAVQLFLMA